MSGFRALSTCSPPYNLAIENLRMWSCIWMVAKNPSHLKKASKIPRFFSSCPDPSPPPSSLPPHHHSLRIPNVRSIFLQYPLSEGWSLYLSLRHPNILRSISQNDLRLLLERIVAAARVASPCSHSYSVLLKCVLNDMQRAGMSLGPEELKFEIYALLLSGHCRKAYLLFQSLLQQVGGWQHLPNPTVVCSSLLQSLLRYKHYQQAHALLNNMNLHHIRISLHTSTILIQHYCRLRHMQVARKLFDQLWSSDQRVDIEVCNILLHGYVQGNQIDPALDLLRKMLFSMQRAQVGIGVNMVSLGTILQYFIKKQQFSKCQLILKMAKLLKLQPDIFIYNQVLSAFLPISISPVATKHVHYYKHLSRKKKNPFHFDPSHKLSLLYISTFIPAFLRLCSQNHLLPDKTTCRILIHLFLFYRLPQHALLYLEFIVKNSPTFNITLRDLSHLTHLFQTYSAYSPSTNNMARIMLKQLAGQVSSISSM